MADSVLVNQVGAYGLNLGRIDFYFDSNKNVSANGGEYFRVRQNPLIEVSSSVPEFYSGCIENHLLMACYPCYRQFITGGIKKATTAKVAVAFVPIISSISCILNH